MEAEGSSNRVLLDAGKDGKRRKGVKEEEEEVEEEEGMDACLWLWRGLAESATADRDAIATTFLPLEQG